MKHKLLILRNAILVGGLISAAIKKLAYMAIASTLLGLNLKASGTVTELVDTETEWYFTFAGNGLTDFGLPHAPMSVHWSTLGPAVIASRTEYGAIYLEVEHMDGSPGPKFPKLFLAFTPYGDTYFVSESSPHGAGVDQFEFSLTVQKSENRLDDGVFWGDFAGYLHAWHREPTTTTPEGGSTAALLVGGFAVLGIARRK